MSSFIKRNTALELDRSGRRNLLSSEGGSMAASFSVFITFEDNGV